MANSIIFQQMGRKQISARVIRQQRKLVAQVRHGNGWQRANTLKAAVIFRNALEHALLQPGDKVVVWNGSVMSLGTLVGTVAGGYEVALGRDQNITSPHILPLDVARSTGVWRFRRGMAVAACVEGEWVRARWFHYANGSHEVKVDGQPVKCPQALPMAEAIEMGLI